VSRTGAGLELVYGECSRCSARAETLFASGRGMFWAGGGACDHGPHERPALDDPPVRRAIAKGHQQGKPVSLRVKAADPLS
jgi:hypothetical protein